MSRPASIFRWVMIPGLLWNLAVVALLASTAFTCYPGLHHDSALYVTPVINLASHGTWEIDSFVPSLISDSGTTFSRHGQLYQWLLGRLLHCGTYRSLYVWIAVLNVLTYVATLLLSQHLLQQRHRRLAPWFSTGIAAMTALVCLWMQGRPEHLIPLLMLAPFAATTWKVTAPHARKIGYAVLGLVVVTSPFPGVLCCLGVVAWIGLRHRQRMTAEVAVCAAISLAVAIAVLLAICPVNPWQWVLNTTQATNGTPSNLGAFFTHLPQDIPYWNLVILGAILLLAFGMCRSRLAWLALIHAAVFYSLLWKLQVYVMAGFVPAIMLALTGPQSESLALPRLLSHVPALIAGFVSITSLSTLLRSGLLALAFAGQGVSFAESQAAVRELRASLGKDERIGFLWLARPSFVVFGDASQGLVSVEPDVIQNQPDTWLAAYEARHSCKVRYLLVPQQGYLLPAPPPPTVMGGGAFKLMRDGWNTRPVTWAGARLADVTPGYQFAVYRRAD